MGESAIAALRAGDGDMKEITGGTFMMGSDRFYPEEKPAREVHVDPFLIDETPVTNDQFAHFVADTGYLTVAEIAPDPKYYPDLPPDMAKAGSAVFMPLDHPVSLIRPNWWSFVFGASWRHPYGPESSIDSLGLHPVVQIAYADALAYAEWAGKRLPTEAEWEFAARGGLIGRDYAWGDELAPGGEMLANYWQGAFPRENLALDGYERTSPVKTYPENGYGLFDMIGNVWEWTSDWYSDTPSAPSKSCCSTSRSDAISEAQSYDPAMPSVRIGRKVVKGGSHLCAENYCRRYRPAARHPQMVDSGTTHIGFRCVRSVLTVDRRLESPV